VIGGNRSGKAECDCKPRFIFSKTDGKCYEAFTQGPCDQSEHFILAFSSTITQTFNNTINGSCPELGFKRKFRRNENSTIRPAITAPNQNLKPRPQCIQNPCAKDRYVCPEIHCNTSVSWTHFISTTLKLLEFSSVQ